MSDADPNSTGVSLTTERDRNVKLHEHFGYGVIAHKQVSDGIQTWGSSGESPNSLCPDLPVHVANGDACQMSECRSDVGG